MHAYSTDSNERTRIPFYLAALSFGIIYMLHLFSVAAQINPPWWVGFPSWGVVYLGLFKIFDRRLWRWPFLHRIGIVKIPLLAGEWKGYGTSSYDGHKIRRPTTITITQSWTQICVSLKGEESGSDSLLAGILTKEPRVNLSYVYMNRPISGAPETMQIHYGTAELSLSRDGKILEGDYYSGRGRGTTGTLHVERT